MPWSLPEARYDLVRVGIAAYGIDPGTGIAALAGVRLRPVMRLRAQLVNVKTSMRAAGVSYGWTWTRRHRHGLGLVPLGYADGIPRHAGNRAEVGLAGRSRRRSVAGSAWTSSWSSSAGPTRAPRWATRSCCSGPAIEGEPTAADWAEWCDTIGYEIVTRIGPGCRGSIATEDGDRDGK